MIAPASPSLSPTQGMAVRHSPDSDSGSDSDSVSGSESSWQDLEPEQEESVFVVSLADGRTVFSSAAEMLAHVRGNNGFDFLSECRRLRLDFLGAVRLVNFLRGRVHDGRPLTQPGEPPLAADDFAGDEYLKPVLEDDGLLVCLGDVLGAEGGEEEDGDDNGEGERDGVNGKTEQDGEEEDIGALRKRNGELARELRRLSEQFSKYRMAVVETLDQRWEAGGDATATATAQQPSSSGHANREPREPKDESEYYWSSYAANDIHETMLKDTVRTDAYRDFIYQHKDLFLGKTVLDVGCGTGILSMLCARAGAARVLAVEKSDIVHKARENVFNNGLSHVVTVIHGAMEEVTLPVAAVDVIVSEWMGYGLLFEAMLPSVLFARDRYLRPDGQLVPSAAGLWIAPVADGELVMDRFEFWRDVYGFDMRAMQAGTYDQARALVLRPESLAGPGREFLRLDLQTITVEELSFTARWTTALARDVDSVDAFLVWFDIFFTRTPDDVAGIGDVGTTAQEWVGRGGGNVGFTTGPYGKATHWEQCYLPVKSEGTREDGKAEESGSDAPPRILKAGAEVWGEISYAVLEEDASARALSISVVWSEEGGGEQRRQRWKIQ